LGERNEALSVEDIVRRDIEFLQFIERLLRVFLGSGEFAFGFVDGDEQFTIGTARPSGQNVQPPAPALDVQKMLAETTTNRGNVRSSRAGLVVVPEPQGLRLPSGASGIALHGDGSCWDGFGDCTHGRRSRLYLRTGPKPVGSFRQQWPGLQSPASF